MTTPSTPPWPEKDGQLLIANLLLEDFANQLGADSFYVYDSQRISDRIALLRNTLPSGIGLHYAVKANPFLPLVQHVASQVDGLDIASAGELRLAQQTTIAPEKISFAGPGKTDTELKSAVEAGIQINLESRNEATRLSRLSQQLGLPARVALRINPAFELRGAGMRMGGGAKPFGIDEEQAPELLKQLPALDLQFEGLHIYAGSQSLRGEDIAAAQLQSFKLGQALADHFPTPMRSFNLGGGLGIPYFPGETPLNLLPVAEALADIQHQATDLGSPDIHLELGRYLVGEAGLYVTRIIEKKVSRGQTFLITAGGMNHHLAASGNLGQVIRKNYPVMIGNRTSSQNLETINIHGPLCTPLDVIANAVALPAAEIGDWVCVFQSGAYGPSASPGSFLSFAPCKEYLSPTQP